MSSVSNWFKDHINLNASKLIDLNGGCVHIHATHLADFKLPALFVRTLKAHNYQGGTWWQLILKLG